MKTRIFAYRDVVGALTDLDDGEFLNDPKSPTQLGCVVSTSQIQITEEAKKLIREAPREGGSFAAIMLTRHADGSGSSIGLCGRGKHIFAGNGLCIGRNCDLSVLDDCEVADLDVPEDFIEVVNTNVV